MENKTTARKLIASYLFYVVVCGAVNLMIAHFVYGKSIDAELVLLVAGIGTSVFIGGNIGYFIDKIKKISRKGNGHE